MKKTRKIKFPFLTAIIPFIIMIGAMIFTVVQLQADPHVPLIVGTIAASFIAWRKGIKWKEIEEAVYQGIKLALPAILIILMIGLIIGSWIGGGVVATMVYYGLQILSPSYFLVSIALICGVITLAIGSSWSTMGTLGVAGMGIGMSMGIPAPLIAGAIISGAYFGDKLSPLSDTTNLAAGIAGTELFDHIKHMLITTVPGYVIALIVFFFLGRSYGQGDVNSQNISEMLAILNQEFVVTPWLLVVPAAVILLVAKKVPALPALTVGVLLGFLAHVFVQGGSMSGAVNTLFGGYSLSSGNELVDDLFTRGGIESMMYTVSLVLVAMAFGGVVEQTGMLKSIVDQILKFAKTPRSLVTTTVGSSFFTNVAAAEQYMSVILPGRMYANAYREQNLDARNLSRAVEDGGTITSVFVPWNTCAVFILATLNVNPLEYAPYAIFNYTVPLLAIIFAQLGIGIVSSSKSTQSSGNHLRKTQSETVKEG
ncbi:Na+/H+ antiporter NhaC [Bacillus lacus]|uniref:Na+/H+ antiporter NhaC n=1 Tax=Metabacillus lacus TaxID=1983721 RepID=A0A7X2M0R2_9BACI|nr:Na+/H+ antiporter NhaC [Metabacillus lacus]